MKDKSLGCLAVILILVLAVIGKSTIYTVKETEQVIITKFGKPIGKPITDAGLKFKLPIIHEVNRFEKRILEWDGRANEMPTKDKTYIIVDTYARWRIADSLLFLEKLRDERSAQSRLSDILGSETRNTIAKNELIEVIRTTKDRKVTVSEELVEADKTGSVGKLIPIRRGRGKLEEEILTKSRAKLAEFGIELLDIRFKRINYNRLVSRDIYARMISERQQIAERFRSEGKGEAAKILGNMERDLLEISSKAYKQVEIIKGQADAKATEIYAKAYNQSLESSAFYEFVKTMEIYPQMLNQDSTLILSTDSDLFQFLKAAEKPLGE